MRILICDDNREIQEQLEKYIRMFFSREGLACPEIDTFDSGEELLRDPGAKDIVFLDIEMPGVSGIFTGAELKKQNPNVLILILTSYSEYLDEAMRITVYRYLSKPIEKERLFRNLRDAIQTYSSSNTQLAVETKEGVKTVSASSVIYIEAVGHKVSVYTTSGCLLSVHRMQYWEEHVPDNCFFRTHRSFIVNMKHVTDFDRSKVYLYDRKYSAYLTRRKYQEFKERYLRFLEYTK